MKRRLKGFLLMMCMLVGMFAMTAGNTVMAAELSAEEDAGYKSSAVSTIETITAFTDEEIEQYLQQYTDEFSVSAIGSWQSSKNELGAYVEVTDQTISVDGTKVTITSQVKFEKGNATVPIVLDLASGSATAVSMSFDMEYTLGQKMTQAGLNTVMGIGIVFLMLVFLTFCISMFKHISKLEKKPEPKPAAPAPVAAAPVVAAEPEELVDDGELVAVIAAAIAASENVSVDGFRVRSIKRANTRSWKNAY